ncbi:MAG TPA: hypothetical protein VKR31_02555 [Rhizomicrobium sp.]|nr:hypothetical protein [Rhizomicrobium sp.]
MLAWGASSDLSVEISQRRWRCVVDPYLCLSPDGAAFVHGLAAQAEVWLGSEFLNVLDSWTLYDREPELLLTSSQRQRVSPPDLENLRQALQLWLRLRDDSGLGGARLCWVRDAVRESRLPDGMDETIVQRWEAMAESLDERLSASTESSGPVIAAMRDAAALAGLLPGAFLLTLRDPQDPAGTPSSCRHFEAWRLPCRKLDCRDDLVVLERCAILHTIVQAGLAGFLWSGVRIAVVHVDVPGRACLNVVAPDPASSGEEMDYVAGTAPRKVRGVWEDARVFWYDLAVED